MPSILDVAKAAEVSPSTVSLAMNHPELVGGLTRRRIKQIAAGLGYRTRGKKRVKASPLNLVFLYSSAATVIDDDLGSYCRELIMGVRQHFSGASIWLSAHRAAEHVEQDPVFLDHLACGDFHGALIAGFEPASGYLQRLTEAKIPVVLFNRYPENDQFSAVTVDYRGAGQLAIEHLIELGHRRVALAADVNPEPEKRYLRQLHEASLSTLGAHGLRPVVDHHIDGAHPEQVLAPQSIEAFCRQALDAGATAIFSGDRICAACLVALDRLGIDVPGHMSVIGSDALNLRSPSGLALTSIGYDKQLMGAEAGSFLTRLIDKPDLQSLTASVKCHLVPGQTTAQLITARNNDPRPKKQPLEKGAGD